MHDRGNGRCPALLASSLSVVPHSNRTLQSVYAIAFGLGMPTPAAYILVAFLIATPIEELGVPDVTTHMFVFYFAMLSAITPPVAISVAVGSRIAGTSFMAACVQALRIGAPGFVIPFAFIANNSIIQWSSTTLFAFPVVLAGTIGLIVATVGFDGARDLSYPMRVAYVVAAAAAMFGGLIAGIAGIAIPGRRSGGDRAHAVACAVSDRLRHRGADQSDPNE